jgi:hypothetical protein
MTRRLFALGLGSVLLVTACTLLPRRDTVAYPAADGPGPAPARLYVDAVDVDRRVLASEVARDVKELVSVLAPGHGFAVAPTSQDGAWPVRLHIVERETIRDFSPQYAVMVTLQMYTSSDAAEPSLTVVHTSESTDSITSPWTLKRILNDCLQEAAKAFTTTRKG